MHDRDTLLLRLKMLDRPLAVVVGAPLSMTYGDPMQGVPDVSGMIEHVRRVMHDRGAGAAFDQAIAGLTGGAAYQAAFKLADGALGGRAVADIVRKAVLDARLPDAPTDFEHDGDPAHWHLPRGTAALGRLLASQTAPFTGPVLTTNFDPLISLAVQAAGGGVEREVLDRDGGLRPGEDQGRATIVHLHGYWRHGYTLHTPKHLGAERSKLIGALRHLLRGHAVLVAAYGGWNDVFTKALAQVAEEPGTHVEVLWTLFGDEAHARHGNDALLKRYEGHPAFNFYCGIDAHALFDELAPADAPAVVAAPPAPNGPEATDTAATPTPAAGEAPAIAAEPAPVALDALHMAAADEGVRSDVSAAFGLGPHAAADADDRPIKMGQPGFSVPDFSAVPGTMVGGAALIDQLHALLTDGGEVGIGQAAALGLGGLGKSRLAFEYAHAHRDDYAGGVIWFDADPQSDMDAQLARISRNLRWVGPTSDDNGALVVGRAALRELTGALIIFDNVEDIEQVRPFRPGGPCAILVTSRMPQDMPALDMKCLDPDAGVELLAQMSRRSLDDEADRGAAREISVWADGLPLALELVGAYLARNPTAGWARTRDRLKARSVKSRLLKPKRGLDKPLHDGQTVEAALTLEEALFEEHPTLATALDMLAGLATSPMGEELLSTLVAAEEPEDLAEALEIGCTLRILYRVPGAKVRYRMHRLVRAVYLEQQESSALSGEAIDRLIGWFRERRRDVFGLEVFDGEGDHLESARAVAKAHGWTERQGTLRWLEAHIANVLGDDQTAFAWAQRARDQAKTSGDPQLLIEMDIDLAVLTSELGDPRGAKTLLEDVTSRMSPELTSPTAQVPAARLLAGIHVQLGHDVEAEEAYQRALKIAMNHWSHTHWQVARARLEWATCHSRRGQDAARSILSQAREDLELIQSTLGSKRQESLAAHQNLGVCLAQAGQDAESIEMGYSVLHARTAVFGSEHPSTLFSEISMAILFNNAGRPNEARPFARSAFDGFRRIFGAEHPEAVDSYVELIRTTIGDNWQGRDQVVLRLKKLRASLAPDHPRRSSIDRLVNTYSPKPRKQKAKKRRRK